MSLSPAATHMHLHSKELERLCNELEAGSNARASAEQRLERLCNELQAGSNTRTSVYQRTSEAFAISLRPAATQLHLHSKELERCKELVSLFNELEGGSNACAYP